MMMMIRVLFHSENPVILQQVINDSCFSRIIQNYKIVNQMYGQYLNSSSSSFDSNYTKSFTNIGEKRYEQNHVFDRTKDSKAYQWNIEESKENAYVRKDRPVTSSYQPTPKPEFSGYLNSNHNAKKQWERPQPEFNKMKSSKSSKNLRFTDKMDSEYEAQKKMTSTYSCFNNSGQDQKDQLKSITVSLGANAKLQDLLPSFKAQAVREKQPKQNFNKSSKSLKACRSETTIKLDQNYSKSRKDIKDFQKSPNMNMGKSYKQIAEYLSDNKYSKKQEKDLPTFGTVSHLSYMNRKDQIPFRPKVEKTSTYNEYSPHKYDLTRFKKHNTADMARPTVKIEEPRTPTKPTSHKQKWKVSINDFELGKCLGEGAFGQVFPGLHKQTKMLVAIKKVPKQKVKYMLEQFINEIKIQLFIDHPNVVKMFGFFDDQTHFYIIMEYMEGGNLFNLIKKQKQLTEKDTAEKLKDICLGLKEMHDNSVLHRDIKPENVVLTNNVCKVCDLGWAAICKDRRNTYCGTLDYVSPQIIGGEGYDDSVDIWCIGVLAYEMICGKTPFYNISRKETMKKIVDVNYEYPAQITPKAKAFIDKILKKNPENRIDVDQVLKDSFLQ